MSLSYRRGIKSFLGIENGSQVVFRCRCDVYPSAEIAVTMSLEQAQALVARKPAREVLAGFPREVVELFSSGLTPAEFDMMYGRSAKPLADYDLYNDVGGADAKPPGMMAIANVGSLF
jgi:hypothetical protein